MFNFIHQYLVCKYKINIKILKGLQTIKTDKEYFVYSLSIIMSYLLQPTKGYGCKSKILYYHKCKSTNKIDRLYRKYKSDTKFKSIIDKSIQSFIDSEYGSRIST